LGKYPELTFFLREQPEMLSSYGTVVPRVRTMWHKICSQPTVVTQHISYIQCFIYTYYIHVHTLYIDVYTHLLDPDANFKVFSEDILVIKTSDQEKLHLRIKEKKKT
jgi:hypothetical protein